MMSFPKVLFWIHLSAGVGAGVVIAIMAFIGVLLAWATDLIYQVTRSDPPAAGTGPGDGPAMTSANVASL
jgi:hypothetical protein